jgi:hypothetical protein
LVEFTETGFLRKNGYEPYWRIMSSKIDKISIYDQKSPNGDHNVLDVKIDEGGQLVMEGHDLGPGVEIAFGDSDYEYWLTIPTDYKDTVLLHLIKDKFVSSHDFEKWLKLKSIPNKRDCY